MAISKAVTAVGGMMMLSAAWAGDAGSKSAYTLLNPTPPEAMREMTADRPDTTESPITVDAGHVQVELSFVDYAYNKDDGVRTQRLAALPTNIKIGVLNNVDVQFVFTPYERIEIDAPAGDDVAEGFSGDTQIRVKINLWGNDGPDPAYGNTAFGIMPFVKFPTGPEELSNDHVEGGLILPLAIELPHEWSLGLMAEIDAVYNEADGDYGVAFVHSATLGHAIPGVKGLDGYIEYVGIAPIDTGDTYQAVFSAGLTYSLTPNWIIDAGGTVGISDSADDFSAFVGTSFRF